MNEHIKNFLKYYVDLDVNPEFAILISGEWGSGKTWFVKNFLNDHHSDKYIWVSLYGITSYKEIEDSFFQQLHPFLASKGAKLISKVLKGFLKTTIHVDLDNDGKSDGNIASAIPDINLPDYLKSASEKILIFDDIERCAIEVENLLGYINQFVESDGAKVILIANEDEILNKNKENHNYYKVKEKVIGRTFKISSSFDLAFDSFLSIPLDLKVKSALSKNKFLIEKLYISANYNNLRHLRYAILDFDKFYQKLPNSIERNTDLFEHIISLFFLLSFEIKKGGVDIESISELFEYYKMSSSQQDKSAIQKIIEKYSVLTSMLSHPIGSELWADYFSKGDLDHEKLEESIKNSSYFEKETTPDWIKLWHYFELEDDEFNQAYSSVFKNFESQNINDKYEVVQITGILLNINNNLGLGESDEYIIELGRKCLLKLKDKYKLTLSAFENYPSGSNNSSHGLAFQSLQNKNFLEFLEYAKSLAIENYNNITEEEALYLLNLLDDSVDSFGMVLNGISENNIGVRYFDRPILNKIPVKLFVEKYFLLKNTDKKKLVKVLQQRFNLNKYNIKIIDELQWLIELKDYPVDKIYKNKTISLWLYKSYLVSIVSEIILNLEEVKQGMNAQE